MYYYLLCRSLTTAQKAERILQNRGIYAVVAKAPQRSNPRGCTYSVRVAERYLDAARAELERAGIHVSAFPEQERREIGGGGL